MRAVTPLVTAVESLQRMDTVPILWDLGPAPFYRGRTGMIEGNAMTYEKALDSFEEAIASVDRRKNPELWHLLQGLHALCTAVRSDVADLKRRHERTQENVARVNAEVTAAQDSLKDLLKGVE